MWNKKNWFSLLLVPKHGRGEMVLDGDDLHEVHLRVAVLVSSTEMDFSLVCGWDSIGGLRSTSHLFKDLVCLDATTTEIYLVLHFSELWFSLFFFLKKLFGTFSLVQLVTLQKLHIYWLQLICSRNNATCFFSLFKTNLLERLTERDTRNMLVFMSTTLITLWLSHILSASLSLSLSLSQRLRMSNCLKGQ